jgi:hypothetical protein
LIGLIKELQGVIDTTVPNVLEIEGLGLTLRLRLRRLRRLRTWLRRDIPIANSPHIFPEPEEHRIIIKPVVFRG